MVKYFEFLTSLFFFGLKKLFNVNWQRPHNVTHHIVISSKAFLGMLGLYSLEALHKISFNLNNE
jgi:hypothetical protein